MVARAGGYYGAVFQGFWGVAQGGPLSPIIFNVVVDALFQNCAAVVEDRVGGKEGHGREVRNQIILFYADEGMLAPTDLECLQGAFDALVGLFDQVGLRMNIGMIVGMLCRPCQAAGTQSELEYERQMTEEGIFYWERQRFRAKCSECGEEMEVRFLAVHQQMYNGKSAGGRR